MRHLFDTSSVRRLSSLSGKEWQTFRKAFRRAGHTSGWIPRVLGAELMGSNLHRKKLTVEGLRDLQLAVDRMNKLAGSVVLPDDIELAQRSIYALADMDYPDTAYVTDKEEWPLFVREFLKVRHPEQTSTEEREGRLYVTIKENDGQGTFTVQLPRNLEFVEHAKRATEGMKAVLAQHPGWTLPAVVAHGLADRIAGDAKEFSIPDAVAQAAIRSLIPGEDDDDEAAAAKWQHLTQQPLIYRMSCEDAYYYRRATNPVEPRPPEPNDAVDLSLTSYLTPDTVLVVEERRLRSGVLSQVKPPRAYCTLDELRRRLGLPVS